MQSIGPSVYDAGMWGMWCRRFKVKELEIKYFLCAGHRLVDRT